MHFTLKTDTSGLIPVNVVQINIMKLRIADGLLAQPSPRRNSPKLKTKNSTVYKSGADY